MFLECVIYMYCCKRSVFVISHPFIRLHELMYIPFQLDVVRQNFLSRTKREQIVCIIIDHVAFSDDGGWLATVSHNIHCLMLNKEFRVQSFRLPMYTYLLIVFSCSFQPG